MPRTKHPSEEVFRNLVGDWPEDAIAPLNTALDALHQLEAILKSIAKEAAGECDSRRIEHLGDAGARIARDTGEYVNMRHEYMLNHLRAAGVVPAEGEQA